MSQELSKSKVIAICGSACGVGKRVVRATKPMLIVGALSFALLGCTDSNQSSDKQNAVVSPNAPNTPAQIVSLEQLKQVSPNMTYGEVIGILGDSQDIGSGRYIRRYRDKDGRRFTLNYGSSQSVISSREYKILHNLINDRS